MAGDVRGTDLDSWWQNRAAYRLDATQSAEQVRGAARGFGQAAGDTVAPRGTGRPKESIEHLLDSGQAAMLSLQKASQQLATLDGQRQQAQAECTAEQSSIQAATLQRVRAERQAAHERSQQTKVQLEKSKTALRKFAAIFLFLVVFYLIIFH
jgi:Fe2+ transport system protein B